VTGGGPGRVHAVTTRTILLDQREANEKLVLAMLRSEELADDAEVAHHALEQALRERDELLVRERAAHVLIEASEQHFRILIESIPQLAWTANAEGWIDFYNQGWYRYTGTSLEEMQGWGWKAVQDPDDLPRILELWSASLRTGTPFETEFRLRGADGVYRWFLTRAVPVNDASGRIVRWFGTNTNIDELRQTRRDLEIASGAKDEFLAMLGHELRNPLAPIVSALELMQMHPDGVFEMERAVIERQVVHMVRLVDDLLDVSRITTGKIRLAKETIEVAELVARAIEIASPLYEQKSHKLTVEVAPDLWIHGDPTRLIQVISNLLTNAAKFTENGGTVTVLARRAASTAILSVRDTGIGIAPELQPRVFDRFVQVRQSLDRSRGGLGLGLAIVKSLVTMHGGSVAVSSDGPGRGSEFTVTLPLSPAPRPQGVTSARAPAAPTLPATATGGHTILIVDDNQDAADMLGKALVALGHEVRVVYDGPSALTAVRSFSPDVALLDIGLPAMDGYELARRLRSAPRLEGVHFVAVTGYGQVTDLQRAREAGFNLTLVKPVSPGAINEAIKSFERAKIGG